MHSISIQQVITLVLVVKQTATPWAPTGMDPPPEKIK
jgi:hypothetical protein